MSCRWLSGSAAASACASSLGLRDSEHATTSAQTTQPMPILVFMVLLGPPPLSAAAREVPHRDPPRR
jgi:hypothetical protein